MIETIADGNSPWDLSEPLYSLDGETWTKEKPPGFDKYEVRLLVKSVDERASTITVCGVEDKEAEPFKDKK